MFLYFAFYFLLIFGLIVALKKIFHINASWWILFFIFTASLLLTNILFIPLFLAIIFIILHKKNKNNKKSVVFFSISLLFLIYFLSLIIRSFVFEPFVYTGNSLKELQQGEYFIVNKLDTKPRIGDIVVVQINNKSKVRRVLEVANDNVVLSDGKYTETLSKDYIIGTYWFSLYGQAK